MRVVMATAWLCEAREYKYRRRDAAFVRRSVARWS